MSINYSEKLGNQIEKRKRESAPPKTHHCLRVLWTIELDEEKEHVYVRTYQIHAYSTSIRSLADSPTDEPAIIVVAVTICG